MAEEATSGREGRDLNGYNNPNFERLSLNERHHVEQVSSSSVADRNAAAFQSDSAVLHTTSNTAASNGHQNGKASKGRTRYRQLDPAEMGVPLLSPTRGQQPPSGVDDQTTENRQSAFFEREGESEYYYIEDLTRERPPSEASDSAAINFYTDDRISTGSVGEITEHHQKYYYESDGEQQQRGMSVDYSPTDFRRSLAAIDAAARDGENGGNFYPGGGVRVRKEGDTTIMTEHRDPYSFYWQLDQARRMQQDPPRPPPQHEYIVDEEYLAPPEMTQMAVLSPDSHDSGIQVEPTVEYSKPQRIEEPPHRQLPAGWERHEDPSGFSYYWHVDSGTIQRDPPPPVSFRPETPRTPSPPPRPVVQTMTKQTQADAEPIIIERIVEQPPQIIQLPPQQPVIQERAFKQTTTKRRVENDQADDLDGNGAIHDDYIKPVRFAVRSLGWTEIAEEELTPEKSSRAVNRAIVDLSTGRNDLIDNVSKWGDGRELIMELDDHDLRLIDPDSLAVLHTQPIHQIRVWGVGRDNGRDFAYVARDRNSRRFMCHVFRCDTPARTIANTLRDICKRLMLERRPNTLQTALPAIQNGHHTERRRVSRESSFPTPMEEPKKVIRCHFLGVTQVPRATGIEILNEAVDRLVGQVRQERWILVDVSIAPSTITITEVGGNQIAECRVRYLSFLGIGRDVKHCAFIMHTSSENFMCYVFHVEPSAGAMAKTIEAACKLRYQKVLDAHSGGSHRSAHSINGKGWGDSIRDVFGSVREKFVYR